MKKIWLGIELSISFFEVIVSPLIRFHLVGFLFGIAGMVFGFGKFCCFRTYPHKFGAKSPTKDNSSDEDAEDPKSKS